jgi:hypothetical protein
MTNTMPERTVTAQQAARSENARWPGGTGHACQAKRLGDHLARYLDAHTAGELPRAYMAAVIAELVVITRWRIIPGDAR